MQLSRLVAMHGSESILIEDRLLAQSAAAGRECGSCTVCCTLLAVDELKKPMRWACQHVGQCGCGIYASRPPSCQQFNCLWLRGGLPACESYRPDRLGIVFECHRKSGPEGERLVALEVWTGAFEEPRNCDLLEQIRTTRELELSRRDGAWATLTPEKGVENPAPAI